MQCHIASGVFVDPVAKAKPIRRSIAEGGVRFDPIWVVAVLLLQFEQLRNRSPQAHRRIDKVMKGFLNYPCLAHSMKWLAVHFVCRTSVHILPNVGLGHHRAIKY